MLNYSVLISFILLTFIHSLIYEKDRIHQVCNKDKVIVIIILFIHSIIDIFISIAPYIFNDKYILLSWIVLMSLITLHWKSNDNLCIITKATNSIINKDLKQHYDTSFVNTFNTTYKQKIFFIKLTLTVVAYKLLFVKETKETELTQETLLFLNLIFTSFFIGLNLSFYITSIYTY